MRAPPPILLVLLGVAGVGILPSVARGEAERGHDLGSKVYQVHAFGGGTYAAGARELKGAHGHGHGAQKEFHEAEEKEEEHEHGHEHEVSVAMITTSYLLIGFLVINFVMLWLVNWPDANVRSYAWKMISATVSIYLAVLLNNSLSGLVLSVTSGLTGTSSGKYHLWAEFFVKGLMFLGCFIVGNALCNYFRHKGQWLYAIQVIGAHFSAFAGIGAFESVMKFELDEIWVWTIGLASIASLGVMRYLSRRARHRRWGAAMGVKGQRGRYHHMVSGTDPSETDEWRDAVIEAEDEACSIINSFIVKDLVMAQMFHKEEGELLESHTMGDIKCLFLAELGCISVLVITTYWRQAMDKTASKEEAHHTSFYTRSINSVQITIAMTMSWLALYLFFWLCSEVFPHIEHEFIEVISAAVLTSCALVGIIVLDFFADKVDLSKEDEGTVAKVTPTKAAGAAASAGEGAKSVASKAASLVKSVAGGGDKDKEKELPVAATDTSETLIPDVLPDALKDLHENVMNEAFDATNLERALRTLIDSFALAVGLAWEHAFHAAIHTVIVSQPLLARYEVESKLSMALGSCLLMLPVWLRFIVPMARKHWKQHQAIMDLAASQS